MDNPDARYLNKDIQEYLRAQAIRLRKQGESFVAIAHYLGVHRSTVSEWWHLYLERGEAALSQYHRGRTVGEGRQLHPQQEIQLQQLLRDHSPDELDIDSALWTRRAVQVLIEKHCHITLPIRTVGNYLKRWGFTPQKPRKRAYEQDPKQVNQWLKVEYPRLKQRAQQEQAEIAWGDEAGRCNTDQVGRSFAPRGQTPEIRLSGKKKLRVNYLACMSNQGKCWFMTYVRRFDSSILIPFMRRLIRQVPHKLFWIVDRHPVHRSTAVKRWLETHQDRIELFFLPSYSPELNPTEYLNSDVKQGVHSAPPTRNLKEMNYPAASRRGIKFKTT